VERVSKVYPVADFEKAIADMKNGTVRLLTTDTSHGCADAHIRSSNQSSSFERLMGKADENGERLRADSSFMLLEHESWVFTLER
jgi:hypothetical protein